MSIPAAWDGADPSGDAAEVVARMRLVYDGYLAGDAAASDAALDPEVTIWDSEHPTLIRGLPALAALRAGRPAPGDTPSVVTLTIREPVVDVWGEVALLRHLLDIELSDGAVERVRNTSVWRRRDGVWLAQHNHEDVLAAE